MPLSQPPPVPSFKDMVVKTSPIETFSTFVATSHISFLWTMLALAAGVSMGLGCMGRSNKDKKDEEKDDEDSSKDSSSE